MTEGNRRSDAARLAAKGTPFSKSEVYNRLGSE